MTSGRFENKGVIVTGGAQGIGRAIVDAFVAEGAHVVAVDILGYKLEAMRAPGTIDTLLVDLGRIEEVEEVIPRALELLDRLDILVNCAAVQPEGPALEVIPEEFDLAIAVNTRAPFILMQGAVRSFTAGDGGAIVNIASANAIRNESPESIYNASKAALIALTSAFAHEFGHLGVRVNAVAPGETLTPEAEAEATDEDRRVEREYLARVPMRRAGRPHEQAAAVLFLASDDASFITGRTLVVDGGELSGDWFDRSDAPPLPDEVI
jgi:NAD(P)-dependent dehydrogenase (short-subunit alcohol dehydrogenase family)